MLRAGSPAHPIRVKIYFTMSVAEYRYEFKIS